MLWATHHLVCSDPIPLPRRTAPHLGIRSLMPFGIYFQRVDMRSLISGSLVKICINLYFFFSLVSMGVLLVKFTDCLPILPAASRQQYLWGQLRLPAAFMKILTFFGGSIKSASCMTVSAAQINVKGLLARLFNERKNLPSKVHILRYLKIVPF